MIQITIPKDHLDDAGHETLVGQRMITLLREAGIPAIGFFAMRGVESGMLIYRNVSHGFDDTAHQFEWYAEGEVMGQVKSTWKGNLKKGFKVLKTNAHADAEDEI